MHPLKTRLTVLLSASILVLMTACGGNPAAQQTVQPALVTVVTASLRDVTDTVTFNGTINARDEMPISLEGESSRIAAVLVEVGDRVRKGQVLARLNPSVIAPQVTSLVASYESARTSAELADADYRRAQGVAASGALSKEEIERRKSQATNAQANVRVAAAQLAEARARLGRTEIRAPADGVVLTRTADVGQTASLGGEPLFRLGKGGQIEMRGRVSEQDMPKLVKNQDATVRVTGIERGFAGKVWLVGAVIDTQTRLGQVRIALSPDINLRPGAFARGEVVVGKARRVVLPQTAVLTDLNGSYVLVVGAANAVQRRAVKVAGTREMGVVVSEGLQGTERVVATAAAFLRDGETIRPTSADASASPAPAAAGARK